MPELPEVETVIREIRPHVLQRQLVSARFAVPRQLKPQTPRDVGRRICGQTICGVYRRGKYILLELDAGLLVVHLRMTGRLYVRTDIGETRTHERAWFYLDNGKILAFRDSRTLGTIRYYADIESFHRKHPIGWEPLEKTVTYADVKPVFERRSIAIKPLLLDQKIWAGIGNIYASEILWESKINPRKPASSLTRAEILRLIDWIPNVLERAIQQGGSTVRDFIGEDGAEGSYQKEFRVYDREHEPCKRCSTPIRRFTQAQRSTYYCPRCQSGR